MNYCLMYLQKKSRLNEAKLNTNWIFCFVFFHFNVVQLKLFMDKTDPFQISEM